jgi:hypothetical protein
MLYMMTQDFILFTCTRLLLPNGDDTVIKKSTFGLDVSRSSPRPHSIQSLYSMHLQSGKEHCFVRVFTNYTTSVMGKNQFTGEYRIREECNKEKSGS